MANQAAPSGLTTKNDVKNVARDEEFIAAFNHDWNPLAEILSIFGVGRYKAGQTLFQYVVSGELETPATEGQAAEYSQYKLDKTPVGSLTIYRWAKQSTMEAMQAAGADNAVRRTDKKALQQVSAIVLDEFFAFLKNGVLEVAATSLQDALAKTEADLADEMEKNGDKPVDFVYFVSRQDVYKYLAEANITLQTVFGMQYVENFLGVRHLFVTSYVEPGTFYATPAENIHVYGADFEEFASEGLVYATQEQGLIGVHHRPDYDHGGVITDIAKAVSFVPEAKNYIVKGTVASVVPTGETGETGTTGVTG